MSDSHFRNNGKLKITSKKYPGNIEGTNDIPRVSIDAKNTDLDDDLYEMFEENPTTLDQKMNAMFYVGQRDEIQSSKKSSGKRVGTNWAEQFKLFPPRVADPKTTSKKVLPESMQIGGKSRRKRTIRRNRRTAGRNRKK